MHDKHPVPHNFESDLLTEWLTEIQQNPRFKNSPITHLDQLETLSKSLLSQLTQGLASMDIPDFIPTEFEPIFKLWHGVLAQQSQSGIPTRDTAMLILSLKSSVNRWLHTRYKDAPPPEILPKLNDILDILGVLTFQVYTNEQDRLTLRQNAHIQYLQNAASDFQPSLGNSDGMIAVKRAVDLIVNTDVTVLLEGETGVGKDVVASLIHAQSNRNSKPYIAVNCGAIPRDLIETELFGHEKGSFTGADATHIGKFELASDGTLFLDEIGELPLDMQVKLLRVLQNQEIQRVGGNSPIKINVRVIAATNKSLKQEVAAQRFREDLFYRLNVYPILIPPLRDRKSDIIPLALHFLNAASERFRIPFAGLSDDAQGYIRNAAWPGNVRELENLMQRAIILAQGDVITTEILSLHPGHSIPSPFRRLNAPANEIDRDSIRSLDDVEAHAIASALKLKNGNILQAAKALGISRTTLYAKAKKHNISI